jgi:hypothetical protein
MKVRGLNGKLLIISLVASLALVLAGCRTDDGVPSPGRLELTIQGLPSGVEADVGVFGPDDFNQAITASTALSELVPGDYEVVAVDVTHEDDIYSATVSESPVTVEAGGTATVSVSYAFEVTAPPDTGSHDDQLALVAEQIPDFGGLFFDEEGMLNVFLLEPSPNREGEVLEAVTAVFGDDILRRGHRPERDENGNIIPQLDTQQTTLKLIQGAFAIPQLLQTYDELDSVLGIEGVVFTDLDEERNRLAIGVEDEAAFERVQQALGELGVDRSMVIVEFDEADILYSHTIRGSFRPTVGGIQIRNAGGGQCTMGFNATRGGVRGFVTNSHCTIIQGGVEATTFFQPTVSGENFIATETADPTYKLGFFPFGSFVHGFYCPPLRRCRVSDSAFARYTSGVTSDLGRIARVTGVGTTGGGSGSITINHDNATYTVVSKTSYPVVGEILDKIGRTTGHTYGKVIKTCQRRNVKDTNFTMLCQDRVRAGVAPGDSGSPVFKWSFGGNVSLYGVLWGGNSAGTEFAFSAIWNLQKDLGTLITH